MVQPLVGARDVACAFVPAGKAPAVLVLLAERVADEVHSLQPHKRPQVHDIVKLRDKIVAHAEHLQLVQAVEATELRQERARPLAPNHMR